MKTGQMVHMANQIAAFFQAYPHDEAVEGVRKHILDVWEPRMRRQLLDHLTAGGDGLVPLVREASTDLRA
ncbi:MAG: formate dehydrogenase subunit delta [Alphaproteobacteria bacterium]|nr:formate dehydrogenase subunit delta [Alphaproteobacteria bacterium]